MPLLPGTSFAKGCYTLLKQLKAHDQIVVWLAQSHDATHNQELVRLTTCLSFGPYEQMWLDETRLFTRLNHLNLVRLLDLGKDNDHLYFVTEQVQGHNLVTWRQQLPHQATPPWTNITDILDQICAGLHYAHTFQIEPNQPLGIIHRRLSPKHIWINEDGQVKIAQLGTQSLDQSTNTTDITDRIAYLSPEQSLAEVIDHRSDLFTLGTIAYELCCGIRPFPHHDNLALLKQIIQCQPTPIDQHRPDIPKELATLIMTLLAKDPSKRPPDAAHTQAKLATIAQHL